MESADLVRPPADGHAPPFRQQRRMVPLGLRDQGDADGEGEGAGEVRKRVDALQAWDIVALDHAPLRDLGLELGYLLFCDARGVAAAGYAAFGGQFAHRSMIPRAGYRSGRSPAWIVP